MLLTLFLEIILSIFTLYGIFMLIYKYLGPSYARCKKEEREQGEKEHETHCQRKGDTANGDKKGREQDRRT